MGSLLSNPQTEDFDIMDLHDVMIEAIQHDRVAFVSILLFYGLTITPSYTQMATAYKAKGVLECLQVIYIRKYP